jgi:hypothetical protein
MIYKESLTMFQRLSDQLLIQAFVEAVILKLDFHFIYLLKEEINKRNLPSMEYETGKWKNVI